MSADDWADLIVVCGYCGAAPDDMPAHLARAHPRYVLGGELSADELHRRMTEDVEVRGEYERLGDLGAVCRVRYLLDEVGSVTSERR